MKLRDTLARLNRAQRSLWFKVAASVVVVVLGIAAFTTYIVTRASIDDLRVQVVETQPPPAGAQLSPEEKAQRDAARAAEEANARLINEIIENKADPTGVAVGITVLVALAVGVIWLGLGLTALGVLLALACVALPLQFTGSKSLADAGKFIAAVGVLTMSFSVLMELLKLVFSGPWQVTAIARNVVHEAVRLKVSLVFIILLIFGLAALPGLLDAGTPLRYRMQSFLAYGTGGTFWIIAVLVLFLATGTVAFEQRDRVIWQTMTKPVAPWQYLLGKWLGVVGVAAVLLTVSASGIFLFAEYLQRQTAVGEIIPYVPDKPGEFATEDRLALEAQVLAARRAVGPTLPTLAPDERAALVNARIDRLRAADPAGFQDTEQLRADINRDIQDEFDKQILAIEPGHEKQFTFGGLEAVKEANQLLTLRYRINVGGNDPRETYRISFFLPNEQAPLVRQVGLNVPITMPIPPSAIDNNGRLTISVVNGDVQTRVGNEATMAFPPDGLELFYRAGSYRINFVRVMLIQWLKLAFLAMVGITAATFLSFSVASMVAFGVFIIAQGAGFLWDALNYYDAEVEGKLVPHRLLIRIVALPIAFVFRHYAEMKPTENLVDGRLVAWGQVGTAVFLLGATTAVLYAIGVIIFRRRELATYSGQ